VFVHIGVTRFRAFTLAGLVATVILGATVAVLPTQVAGAATDVVTNCSGSASTPGSLPYEVANASLGDTVTFALSPLCTTITLGATITISDNLTITGPGSGALAIIGTGSQSDFTVGSAATATISGLTIEDGGGSAGGGIANSGTLTIVNTTVSGNSATYYGGGIDNSGTLTITNSTVSNNGVKYQQGGGIYNNGMLSVSGTTISNNNATLVGGGIDNLGTLSIANSTLSGNTSGDGGALYSDVSGHTTVTNSTIADNSASNGSDIYNNLGGTLSIGASIVANGGSGLDCIGTLVDAGYNLDDDNSCGFSGTSFSGEPAGLDPDGLQNNGGPTATIALEPASIAIDAVTNPGQCPPTDQRGFPRTSPCDIGAFDTDLVVVTPCPPGTTSCTASLTALSQSVSVSGTKQSNAAASITLEVTPELLSCPNVSYPAFIATLTDTGLTAGSSVQVTDTVKGLPSKKGVVICYQPVGPSPPTPIFLKKCHRRFVAACYKSVTEVAGSVVAQLELTAGDPRFHVGGATPQVTAVSPASARPGKKLTIKGTNLSEVTGVTIGGISARITKTAPTKVTVVVPAGAHSGVVAVTSLAGVSTSASALTVT